MPNSSEEKNKIKQTQLSCIKKNKNTHLQTQTPTTQGNKIQQKFTRQKKFFALLINASSTNYFFNAERVKMLLKRAARAENIFRPFSHLPSPRTLSPGTSSPGRSCSPETRSVFVIRGTLPLSSSTLLVSI
jgi:hypothetical protein